MGSCCDKQKNDNSVDIEVRSDPDPKNQQTSGCGQNIEDKNDLNQQISPNKQEESPTTKIEKKIIKNNIEASPEVEIPVINDIVIDKYQFYKFTMPVSQTPHKDTISTMDICEKRNLLVSGSFDKSIKIWNYQDNKLFKKHQDNEIVLEVVFSSEGDLIAYRGGGAVIKLIEIDTFKVSELKGHEQQVNRLAFSNDQLYLVSGGYDKIVRIWNIQKKLIQFCLEPNDYINGVAISRENTLIASHSPINGINIWQFDNKKLLCTLKLHSEGDSVQFSNNEQMLITSGCNGLVQLWSLENLKQGKLNLIKSFQAANSKIQKLMMTYDCKYMVLYCFQDEFVKVMDLKTGETIKTFKLLKKMEKERSQEQEQGSLVISKTVNLIAYGDGNDIVVIRSK